MAFKSFITLAVVAIVLPTVAIATQYTVGDDAGWTVKFDYQAWAKDKVFYVGDQLVFKYKPGNHNVFKVNGTVFSNCIIPPPKDALTTGNDIITLATPGKKWYICGVKNHCADLGMKLAITVQAGAPTQAPLREPVPGAPTPVPGAPTPTPTKSAGIQITSSASQVIITAAMVFIAIIIV